MVVDAVDLQPARRPQRGQTSGVAAPVKEAVGRSLKHAPGVGRGVIEVQVGNLADVAGKLHRALEQAVAAYAQGPGNGH